MDVLSDVLRAVRLTGAVYFDIDASSPWVGESPDTSRIAAKVMPGVEHVISFRVITLYKSMVYAMFCVSG